MDLHPGSRAQGRGLRTSLTTYRQDYGFTFGQYEGFGPGIVRYPTNIYDPAFVSAPSVDGFPTDIPRSSIVQNSSIAIADTISFWDDRVALTVGARIQNVSSDNYNIEDGSKTSSYSKSAVTPAVALVVKPLDNLSFYANYIEGLSSGVVVSSFYENAGEVFPPQATRQMEVGAKYDFGRFTATASLFQIEMPNGMSVRDNTTGLSRYTYDGRQKNTGVELNVFGEVADGLRVLGGVTYTDARMERTYNGIYDGKVATGVPRWQGRLGVEWDTPFVEGLTLSARLLATDSAYVTSSNELSIPGWTRVDVGAKYRTESFGRPLTVRASIENLFDNDYWSSTGSQRLYFGAPRTFKLSATMDF